MATFGEVGQMTGPLPVEVRLQVQPRDTSRVAVVVTNLYELIRCLAAGHTVYASVHKFPSWERDVVTATGMVPYPDPQEESESLVPVRVFGYDTGKCRVMFESEAVPPTWGDEWTGYLLFGYVERYMVGMVAYLPPNV